MKRLIFLIIILVFANNVSAIDSLKTKAKLVVYKALLRDGTSFKNSVDDKTVYFLTDFARIKLKLSEIDSVEIGNWVVKLLKKDILQRDIVYLHNGFKLGGILTVKKKRSSLKLGKLNLPREDLLKIVILHEDRQ